MRQKLKVADTALKVRPINKSNMTEGGGGDTRAFTSAFTIKITF